MNEQVTILPGMIEQYVLGLCTDAERSMIDQLRQKNAMIDADIQLFEKTFEAINMQKGLLPSKATDEAILTALSLLNQSVSTKKIIPIHSHKFRVIKQFAIAASVMVVLSVGYYFALFAKYRSQQIALIAKNPEVLSTLPVSDYNIIKDPTITPIPMYGVGIHTICRCTMFWDKKTGKVYIMIHHLPRTDDTKDFQLWAMVNGKPISVGIINDAIRDRFIEIDQMPEGATAFSVTLENAGGGATPSDDQYLSGKI